MLVVASGEEVHGGFLGGVVFDGEEGREGGGDLFLCGVEFRFEVFERNIGVLAADDFLVQSGDFGLEGGGFGFPIGLFLSGGLGEVVGLEGGPEGLKAVVIRLTKPVKLVIMAAGAAEGDAHETGPDDVGHFGEGFVAAAGDGLVAGVAADGAEAVEAGGDEGFVFRGGDFVARELFVDEAVPGLVVIEGADDVVAVAPGVGAEVVVFEAFSFGEADDVEPVLAPAFAVVGGGEEAVDDSGPGVGGFIGEEGGDFGGGGGEACEVEGYAADKSGAVGFGGVVQGFFL